MSLKMENGGENNHLNHCESQSMANRNILSALPRWCSRWFGHRPEPLPNCPNYVIWIWSFIGAFCGISVLQAVFEQAHYFIQRRVPTIIASYVCHFLKSLIQILFVKATEIRVLLLF